MITFTSLINPAFDYDLLPHWIEHYRGFNFDEYTVFLHYTSASRASATSPSNFNNAYRMLENAGFNVYVSTGEFKNGMLRIECMELVRKNLKPDDYIVTADSDEFHDIPPDCDYKELILSHDAVRGELIDCYDTSLHDARIDSPLYLQYPLTGHVDEEVLSSMPEVYRQSWPTGQRRKVLASKATMPVNFSGSHYIFGETGFTLRDASATTTGRPGNTIDYHPKKFKVRHYSWRTSVLSRMASKTYYNSNHLYFVMKFFGIDIDGIELKDCPQAFIDKIRAEEALQVEKGWVA